MSRRRRQELHCHACERYVQFVCDLSLDGNHVLNCPNCGHEHCRVVKDGVITDDRWDSRNGPTSRITAAQTAFTNYQVYGTTSASFAYLVTGY